MFFSVSSFLNSVNIYVSYEVRQKDASDSAEQLLKQRKIKWNGLAGTLMCKEDTESIQEIASKEQNNAHVCIIMVFARR